MSDWFLHSREGNSFYFRRNDMPDTDMEGFTLSYVKPGYTVLTGDMGCLTWQRQSVGFDYGFPYNNTNIEYFAEKVCRAENQKTVSWDYLQAVEDIRKFIEDDYKDDECYDEDILPQLNDMIACSTWDEYSSEVGKYKMYEDLDEYLSDYEDWCEINPGEIWEPHFKRKFEMVKSVSDQILKAVSEEKA